MVIKMQKTIFIVDDSSTNLAKAEEALENHYLAITLSSAAKMFEILKKITPDLILLDIEMPDMDGLEALKALKASDKHSGIPVIFLTGLTDSDTEACAIELGAADFIIKPFSKPVLLNRVKNHLHFDEMIREKTERLEQLQSGLVYILNDLVENCCTYTGEHIDRVAEYTKLLIDDPKIADIFIQIKDRLEATRGEPPKP
jgi:putative two-component system response regulator